MRMPEETLVEERVEPRTDVLIAPPLVRGLPVPVPSLPIAEARGALARIVALAERLPARLARLPGAIAARTLDALAENGLAPLVGLLRRSPLIGWALAIQFAISGAFGILKFGVEPMLVALLAFVLAMLVLNSAAARLESEGDRT